MKLLKFIATLSMSCIFILFSGNTKAQNTVKINDWEVSFDTKKETITLSRINLGEVLNGIEFQVNEKGALKTLSGLKMERVGYELLFHSSKPVKADIKLSFKDNGVVVNSSVKELFVKAVASAPTDRFPARVADPDNIIETETPGRSDYTGFPQIEKSYIPETNPHVMYLSLGAIESPNLHALFDKQTNSVIKFTPGTQLTRCEADQNFMEVKTALKGGDNSLIELIPDYFTDVLGNPNYIPLDDTYHKTAPTGWNHWLAFFREVTEKDIVDHADFIAENLLKYGMEHCQLDDGYDHTSRRLWVKNWDPVTFPNGPEYLANYINSKGLIAGLWTVPYCYSVNDAPAEWFLRDDNGDILMDYQGGGQLDFTREDVINEYWIPLWKELKRQGWGYHKFDIGNTASMWYTYQHNFSDTTMSSYDATIKTMKIWREIMGPEVWHVNHPDVEGGRMGFLDIAGLGRDPGVGWEMMNNMLEVISNNTYQNHIIWYSDPDCIVLRGKPTRADYNNRRFGKVDYLTLEEARTCASLLGMSGMQYLSGDDLINLEEDRMDLIRKTIPTMPIFPVDLYGRGRERSNYPEIMDLKVNQNSRNYDVVTVTNWQTEPIERSLSFEKELSLEPGQSYVVFDFWKQEMIGTFKGDFKFEIPAHGTRTFLVHKLTNQPQLLATNRHFSGTYSIKQFNWDNAKLALSGVSETVPGADYTLYFYVPAGLKFDGVNSSIKGTTHQLHDNGLLEVTCPGSEQNLEWSLKFKK